MAGPETTSWTILRAAAAGTDAARADFIQRYLPAVRGYLAARWKGTILIGLADDAVQEVFVELLKPGGILEDGLDRLHGNSFRPYLYGIARNVARMIERREYGRREEQVPSMFDMEAHQTRMSRAFDRGWAKGVLAEAIALLRHQSLDADDAARLRVELLRLRFAESLPVREIAVRLGAERKDLYREMDKARAEFMKALTEVLRRQHGVEAVDLSREGQKLLEFLR